jgi:glycerophosphoryl diester phosphodiesterase
VNLRREGGRPLVVGHRGASATHADNSPESLEAAVAAGADLVELDVSPGLVVTHSPGEAAMSALGLDAVLDLLEPHPVGLHLDLKQPGYEWDVVERVRARNLGDRVLISTAWPATGRTIARIAPELPCAIGYPRDRYGISRLRWPAGLTRSGAAVLRATMPARVPALLRAARADVLALHHTLCSRAAISTAHRFGAPVFAWTVNDADSVRRLAALGVDAVVSDDPAMALATLAAR